MNDQVASQLAIPRSIILVYAAFRVDVLGMKVRASWKRIILFPGFA